jgi:hypothetical protein
MNSKIVNLYKESRKFDQKIKFSFLDNDKDALHRFILSRTSQPEARTAPETGVL